MKLDSQEESKAIENIALDRFKLDAKLPEVSQSRKRVKLDKHQALDSSFKKLSEVLLELERPFLQKDLGELTELEQDIDESMYSSYQSMRSIWVQFANRKG